jgi:hypothetical protein
MLFFVTVSWHESCVIISRMAGAARTRYVFIFLVQEVNRARE